MRSLRGILLIINLLLATEFIAFAQTPTPSQVSMGGIFTNQLLNPARPSSPINQGCPGTANSYIYVVAALDGAGGMTSASPPVTIMTTGSCSLGPLTYNTFTTSPVIGSASCIVWRTSAPSGVNTGKLTGNVLCGSPFYDIGLSVDSNFPTNAPQVNTTGALSASGTVSAQTFLATGTGAGTSDWVQGNALLLCGNPVTNPQPCIQPNSFFISANSSVPTAFGWISPTAQNTANNVLVVAAPGGGIASTLGYGSLTDASSTTPVIATANGSSFSNNHLVSANTSSGVDLADSGIAIGVVTSPTDFLTITPGTTTTPTVTIAATGSDAAINLSHLTKGTGVHSFQPGSGGDSTQMFQLKNAAGTTFASFDSSGKQFRIGDNQAPAATLDVQGGFQVNSSGTPIKEGGTSLVGGGLPGIVYNSVSGSATNGSIGASTIFTAPATNAENCGGSANATCYRISFYAVQVGAGTGCTANTNIAAQVVFQDPLAGGANTMTVAAFLITTNGTASTPISPSTGGSGVTLAVGATGGYTFRAKPSTVIQYATTLSGGTGCTTKPTYWIIPSLEQF